MASNLGDGAVHGTVVLTRGDDQVHLFDQAIAIHPVVMEQGAPGGFADPHGFMGSQARPCPHVGIADLGIGKQLLHLLEASQDLNEACEVIEE